VFRASAAAGLAAAFAALAVLVADGRLAWLDRWAVDHPLPGVAFSGGKPTLAQAVIPLWDSSWTTALAAAANVVTLPAAFAIATCVVAAACVRLRGHAAVALGSGYVAVNAVEQIAKSTLTRPALYHDGLHLAGFDNSFPSGHTLRSVWVALAVTWAWPRFGRWAVAWMIASIALVQLDLWHVPSDVAGGLLLAAAAAATTWSWRPGPRPSRSPSPACRPSARAR
jgi:membrane-associated phospholipid phosphatase